jgi:hypothetical protein
MELARAFTPVFDGLCVVRDRRSRIASLHTSYAPIASARWILRISACAGELPLPGGERVGVRGFPDSRFGYVCHVIASASSGEAQLYRIAGAPSPHPSPLRGEGGVCGTRVTPTSSSRGRLALQPGWSSLGRLRPSSTGYAKSGTAVPALRKSSMRATSYSKNAWCFDRRNDRSIDNTVAKQRAAVMRGTGAMRPARGLFSCGGSAR